ncbi:MAG: hypothetical protein RLO17_23675 [Cyclobacteriaceae bacterium]|jgi:hypothetical protein|tara:strand:+ start:4827 stop:5822 length:996 start_codon:yes stop_codon:yes gene_type:complete
MRSFRVFHFILFLLYISCHEESEKLPDCPGINEVILSSPYQDPLWHPSGDFIGFNYTPLKRIIYDKNKCLSTAEYEYDFSSRGYYFISPDGTNQRMVLPFHLNDACWSNSGDFIVFSKDDGTICKIKFENNAFEENVTQISAGERFWEAVLSPGDDQIAYVNRIQITDQVGIWISDLNTAPEREYFVFGGSPQWLNSTTILYIGVQSIWKKEIGFEERKLFDVIDPSLYVLNSIRVNTIGEKLIIDALSNSLDISGRNLWSVNIDGSDLQLFHPDAQSPSISNSTETLVAFTAFDGKEIDHESGTIWLKNIDGSNERQLTFHDDLQIEFKE